MIILFGAGKVGKMALEEYGRERVAYFCANRKKSEVNGVPVISFEKLKSIHRDYDVIVTPWDFRVRCELIQQLEESGISYKLYEPKWNDTLPEKTLHIYGSFPELNYEMNTKGMTPGSVSRVFQSCHMLKRMFRLYESDFVGKQVDIYLYLYDSSMEAYEIAKKENIDHIFAYNVTYAEKDRVIPVPDYRTVIDDDVYFHPETLQACRRAAEKTWVDNRAFWRGNPKTNVFRKWLSYVAENILSFSKLNMWIWMRVENISQ